MKRSIVGAGIAGARGRARDLLARLMNACGVLRLWQTVSLRERAVVLMYHRVLTAQQMAATGSHPGIVVSVDTFARQMELLKRRFNVLSVEQFAKHIEGRVPFPPSSCLITFDDGWHDNLTNALPILERFGLPALVFLPVDYVGERRLFWREALTHLTVEALRSTHHRPDRARNVREILEEAGIESVMDSDDSGPLPRVVSAIAGASITRAMAERTIARLSNELGIAVESLQTPDVFVGWSEVEQMRQRGVRFGGHGALHLILTDIEETEAAHEIARARQVLDEKHSEPVPTFSYPNGGWAPPIADLVRSIGYRLAFTTDSGPVSCHDDPFSIRRVNVHEGWASSPELFLAHVLGVL